MSNTPAAWLGTVNVAVARRGAPTSIGSGAAGGDVPP